MYQANNQRVLFHSQASIRDISSRSNEMCLSSLSLFTTFSTVILNQSYYVRFFLPPPLSFSLENDERAMLLTHK